MIWSISWKNVWRNKIRSMVVIVAFTLGIFGGVYMVAVMAGMADSRVKLAIGNEASHIQVHHPAYHDNNELKYTINDYHKYLDQIEKIPEVIAVSPRIKIMGMASTAGNASGVVINGIDVGRERQVSGIAESLVEGGGTFFGEEGRKPIVIGEKLAKSLKINYYQMTEEDLAELADRKSMRNILPRLDSLKEKQFRREADLDKALARLLGKSDAERFAPLIKAASIKFRLKRRIVLSFQSLDGNIVYDAFRVVGVYKSGNSVFDGLNLFVRMSDIGPVANLKENQVNQFAILLTSVEHDDMVTGQVKEIMPEMDVQAWYKIMPEAGMYAAAMDYMLFIFMIIILLALGFGIVNTMLMAILDRVKELGMLMAIGMNKKRVFRMIMLETVFLGLTGAVIGMVLSYLLVWYTGKTGLDLTSLYQEGFEAMGLSPMVYPMISWKSFLQLILMVVLTGVIASIYPARKAIRLNPSEALRIDM